MGINAGELNELYNLTRVRDLTKKILFALKWSYHAWQ
jgi:hypothetical protein